MYLDAIFAVFRGRKFVKPKPSMLFELSRLLVRVFLYNLLKKDTSKEQIFNQKLIVGNYEDFLKLFIDIFIRNQYYFATERNKPTIIDAGAHIGMATLYFKLLYPYSHVICFEPNPEAFSILKQNVENNSVKGITLYNFALSKSKGRASFQRRRGEVDWGGRVVHRHAPPRDQKLEVKTRKLSSYIPRKVDLLKLDIEGSEAAVLEELDESKKISNIDTIILEYHWERETRKGNKLSKIVEILEKNNFAYYVAYFFRQSWHTFLPFSTLKYLSNRSNFLIYATKIEK